jgi:microcystin-dependent protein
MAFNLASCPSGWSALDGTGGRLDLRGRTVIGAGTGSGLTARSLGETGGDEKTDVSGVGINVDVWGLTTQTTGALGNPADTTGNTIGKVGLGTAAFYPYNSANQIRFPSSVSITSSGTAGGSAGNMQPFVALLYCQKD